MKTREEILNLARCALINLHNLAHTAPGIEKNPMYQVVEYQLNCAIADKDPDLFQALRHPAVPPKGACL